MCVKKKETDPVTSYVTLHVNERVNDERINDKKLMKFNINEKIYDKMWSNGINSYVNVNFGGRVKTRPEKRCKLNTYLCNL